MTAPDIPHTPLLTAILITRNERRHIAGCLRSVAFCDEVVVVDNGSTDGTAEAAAGLGARVIHAPDWPGFGAQKNRALAAASGVYVFSIDADERVTPELAAAIRAKVSGGWDAGVAGYEVLRLSDFCGQTMRHGDWYPDRVLRLFRRDGARFSDDRVHERLIVDGPVQRLPGVLRHDSVPTPENALDKMNRYTSGRAQDRLAAGKRSSVPGALGHAAWAFVRGYVLKRGFLDGWLGLVLALHVAETTFWRHLKIWLARRPGSGTDFDAR